MNISVVTLFPALYKPFFSTSLVERAQKAGIIDPHVYDLFSYAAPKERVDGPTFGHGAGMVIKPEIVERAVTDLETKHGSAYKVFFSPRGKKLDQLSLHLLYERMRQQQKDHLMLLPARYEGMDARIETEYADDIISIGDFVLMGGDLPAMVFLEGLLRFVPAVVGKSESVEQDSFTGPFVDYPEYTAPVEWKGHTVPEILRSGNHKAIADWRLHEVARESVVHHFDWVRSYPTHTPSQEKEIQRCLPNHYVVLMHSEVLVIEDKVTKKTGTTSVTSLDIHDIARSATTYGLKNYFIVTPLSDQQAIVKTLLGFWQQGPGISYNNHRHEAVNRVILEATLDNVIAQITEREGKPPLLIATGAQKDGHPGTITFNDQEKVWVHDRPVLIILGTGQGLSPELMERCDYRFVPLEGFSAFNHLSVRSAAAVIFDRWLGKSPSKIDKKDIIENDSMKFF
jgi:tRNA (guanine37-N1)-methyltransferase